jgi:hypothetical protein
MPGAVVSPVLLTLLHVCTHLVGMDQLTPLSLPSTFLNLGGDLVMVFQPTTRVGRKAPKHVQLLLQDLQKCRFLAASG